MEYKTNYAFGLVNTKNQETDIEDREVISSPNSLFTDKVVFSKDNLSHSINLIRGQRGIITSRWILVTGAIKSQRVIEGDKIAFVNPRFGREEEFITKLREDNEVKAIYSSKGIYDYVLISSSGIKLETLLKGSPTRDSILFDVEKDFEIPGIFESPQLGGHNYFGNNKYERNYQNNLGINLSYFRGCQNLAKAMLDNQIDLGKTLVYAPLRGAKPITDIVMEFVSREGETPRIVYPVTSSFVLYPDDRFFSKNGKTPASGRYANILELRRLNPRLRANGIETLVYIDEIVSGGMLMGHCLEMIGERKEHIFRDIHHKELDNWILRGLVETDRLNIFVFGLADANGERFGPNKRRKIEGLMEEDLISFDYFPVDNLITEDQRYVLGIHYLANKKGPHSVPLVKNGKYPSDRQSFIKDFVDKYVENGTRICS